MLVDWQIAALCRDERLVTPFDPALVNPHSLDIRLGFTLLAEAAVPPGQPWPERLAGRRWEEIDLGLGDVGAPFWLERGDFVLGSSLETIRLPATLGAQFHLKSSRAREGYGHSLAGLCDAGWEGVLTLELSNHSATPLPLYPGLRIGQMTFHPLEGAPRRHYGLTGRYNGDRAAQASRG